MQHNIQHLGAQINAPGEGQTLTVPTLANYTCSSVTTSSGLRRHTISTTSKALAFAFLEQSFQMDDLPDFVAVRGTFSVQFYADDAECLSVIEEALGGAL